MKWIKCALVLAAGAVSVWWWLRMPALGAHRVCRGPFAQPASPCPDVVRIWARLSLIGVWHLVAFVWIGWRGNWYWGTRRRRPGLWIELQGPDWQESFVEPGATSSACPTERPDPGPTDCGPSPG